MNMTRINFVVYVNGKVYLVFNRNCFYRAMLCIRGTSHGPVSVRLSVCLSVCPNAGGVDQNRRLSTNNRLYLENGTR